MPDGLLIFDVLEPTRADIRGTQGAAHAARRRACASWRAGTSASAGSTSRCRYRGHATTMRLHWVPGEHWRDLLEAAGFEVLTAFAGFEGQPFTGERGDSAWIALRP